MKRRYYRQGLAAGTLLLLTTCATGFAQADNGPGKPTPAAAAPTLDAAAQKEIVEKIGAELDVYYVYPEMAAKLKTLLRDRLKTGAYEKATSGREFAALLNRDLRGTSRDLHLGVFYSEAPQPVKPEEKLTEEEMDQRDAGMRKWGESQNWAIPKAEVLPGNIGYLKVHAFPHPDWAGETIAAAFDFLSRTDALIIDLRKNGGGYPQTVALWTSYLVAPRSIHGGSESVRLFDQYDHRKKETSQIWTAPYVPGRKYLNKPVYLLIGDQTFSGGEILADTLQSLKRATLIGERTVGGSNSMLTRPINEHFKLSVSFGNTVNAVTKKNFDGIGVSPDIAAPRKAALETAHLIALKTLAPKQTGDWDKQRFARYLAEAEQKLAEATPRTSITGKVEFRLKGSADAKSVSLAGNFNDWDRTALPMVKEGDAWVARLDLAPGRYAYRFVVDDRLMPDPENSDRETDFLGNENSVRTVK